MKNAKFIITSFTIILILLSACTNEKIKTDILEYEVEGQWVSCKGYANKFIYYENRDIVSYDVFCNFDQLINIETISPKKSTNRKWDYSELKTNLYYSKSDEFSKRHYTIPIDGIFEIEEDSEGNVIGKFNLKLVDSIQEDTICIKNGKFEISYWGPGYRDLE